MLAYLIAHADQYESDILYQSVGVVWQEPGATVCSIRIDNFDKVRHAHTVVLHPLQHFGIHSRRIGGLATSWSDGFQIRLPQAPPFIHIRVGLSLPWHFLLLVLTHLHAALADKCLLNHLYTIWYVWTKQLISEHEICMPVESALQNNLSGKYRLQI